MMPLLSLLSGGSLGAGGRGWEVDNSYGVNLSLSLRYSECIQQNALRFDCFSRMFGRDENSWGRLIVGKKNTDASVPELKSALPVVFVSDVKDSSEYFRDKLGFTVDFLYGEPPFYGSVSREGARLHLRFVHEPILTPAVREREDSLLSAYIEVVNLKSLFADYKAAGFHFAQRLKKEAWGASSFIVLDPGGNFIYFCEPVGDSVA